MRKLKNLFLSAAFGAVASIWMVAPVFAIDKDIVIIHTNDTHCGIEDNMGFEGVSAYEKQAKTQTPFLATMNLTMEWIGFYPFPVN